ncbi:MAG: type II CAAX prenyl endopeptidase Rce1 family protein [Vulcanisaeta sp. AZ3]
MFLVCFSLFGVLVCCGRFIYVVFVWVLWLFMFGDVRRVVYVVLPVLLWPLSFDVFSRYFVYGMALSTLLLGLLTLVWFPGYLRWFRFGRLLVVLIGVVFAFIMYVIFIGGYAFLTYLGLSRYVVLVYAMVRGMAGRYVLAVVLVLIGFMEEVYWRGGLQGLVGGVLGREPWVVSMVYYTLVHVLTFNPALVAGAFVVGLVDGLLADRVGLVASIITHVVWLELIMVLLPL